MKEIVTKNLILRKANKNDLNMIWNNIWKDNEISDMMLWVTTKTLEEAEKRLERTIKYQSDNYAYFVCLKENNEPIGFAGVKEIESGIFEESGICIAKKYWNKGYAKEVVQALKHLIFNDLNGNKFLYGCFSINEKSRKVCLSLGFTYVYSKKIVREHDGKDFTVDYYEFTKQKYEGENINEY